MEQLIPLISRLQDVFTAVGSSPIELPQLVVVGSQSSGKSSVLEHLVGRDFLPRGNGIVTRRPLILQLVNTRDDEEEEEDDDDDRALSEEDDHEDSNDSDDINTPAAPYNYTRKPPATAPPALPPRPMFPPPPLKPLPPSASSPSSSSLEWGEFLHLPGQRFTNFADIRAEIEADTERLTGKHGISSQPISLSIHSPHVLNLALVDLPGITKVAVGDQPSDIERVVHELVLQYISNPSSLILAVTAANTDLANSDALKIAKHVDPEGRRTIGVLTKLDLMDRGTDATAALLGHIYPLHHGFVGVVCRSQLDIQQQKPIAAAVKAEKLFFANHTAYRPIANRMGTAYLASRLSSLLMSHIQHCLPDMRQKLASTITETQGELDSYGSPITSADHASSILLPLVSAFSQSYHNALEGQLPDVSLTELYGGARIGFIFRDVFTATIMRIDPFDSLTDTDIRIAIHNAAGPRTALFIPEIAFDLLVKKQIARLLPHALECVELVYAELCRVMSQCEGLMVGLARFPLLKAKVMQVANELLRSRVEPCKGVISNFIQCELAYINTSHPDFIGGSAAVAGVMKMQQGKEKGDTKEKGGERGPGEERRPSVVDKPTGSLPAAASQGASASGAGQVNGVEGARPALSSIPSSGSGSPSQSPLPSARGAGLLSMLWGGSAQQQHQQQAAQTFSPAQGGTAHSGSSLPSSFTSLPVASSSSFLSPPLPSPSSSSSPSSRDLIETAVIKSLISSYFLIVKKSICDFCPKAIMCHLVHHSRATLQAAIIQELYAHGAGAVEGLMREGEEMAEKRRSCQELIGILEKAMDIVNQARDFKLAQ